MVLFLYLLKCSEAGARMEALQQKSPPDKPDELQYFKKMKTIYLTYLPHAVT